jgi:hypothetical protein
MNDQKNKFSLLLSNKKFSIFPLENGTAERYRRQLAMSIKKELEDIDYLDNLSD